ncbi:MAG TPA: FkbM family methyltransferase [Puia sp.]|jgi:FkbM family methyltransferase
MRIKKILLSVLGEKKYLSLLAGSFQRLYRTGWLGREYQDVYFLKKFIREGDTCIDIGAHLGYFTVELSRLVKDSGKVVAIEPMSQFNRTLQRLLQRKNIRNVTLHQVALGGNGEYVEMGIPEVGDMKRFAYARVKDPDSNLDFVESEKVKNESGDHLFRDLPRIDFIKCDVEGLEFQVFASMPRTLATHHPVLLLELFERTQRIRVFELLHPLGYRAYTLDNGKWTLLNVYAEGEIPSQNNYFIPAQHEQRLRHLIG